MNLTLKTLIVSVMCISVVNCTFLESLNSLLGTSERVESSATATKEHALSKRQVPFMPDGSFMDYAAYDYYDWVCGGGFCQICDVLSGVCCNPNTQQNCFLPDSCANNPCLSGGTCVNSLTVYGNRDFTCVCQRGLTGKYCQLIDEFTPPLVAPIPVPVAVQDPPYGAAPYAAPQQPAYAPPQPTGYAQPQAAAYAPQQSGYAPQPQQPSYAQPQPAAYAPQQASYAPQQAGYGAAAPYGAPTYGAQQGYMGKK